MESLLNIIISLLTKFFDVNRTFFLKKNYYTSKIRILCYNIRMNVRTGGLIHMEEKSLSRNEQKGEAETQKAAKKAEKNAARKVAKNAKAKAKKEAKANVKVKKATKKDSKISIRTQMLAGFGVPIILIIILGTRVFQMAKEGLVENYMQGAEQTLQVSAQLMDNELSHIKQIALNLYVDDDLYYYSMGLLDGTDADSVEIINNLRRDLSVHKTDDAIANIYIIPATGVRPLSTVDLPTSKSSATDVFEYIAADLENVAYEQVDQFGWASTHDLIDEYWEKGNAGYITSCYVIPRNKRGIYIIDVSKPLIQDIMESISIPDGAYLSFITHDGREIMISSDPDATEELSGLASEDFYIEASESKIASGSKMVEYQGMTYLFMYHLCAEDGSMVAELVPESVILAHANQIRC